MQPAAEKTAAPTAPPKPPPEKPAEAIPPPVPTVAAAAPEAASSAEPVSVFLEGVAKRRPSLAARLADAAVSVEGNVLRIVTRGNGDFREALRLHSTALDDAAREALGAAATGS